MRYALKRLLFKPRFFPRRTMTVSMSVRPCIASNLASLRKLLARNRKFLHSLAAIKGTSPWARARGWRLVTILWASQLGPGLARGLF
jgi:hypothetical protein